MNLEGFKAVQVTCLIYQMQVLQSEEMGMIHQGFSQSSQPIVSTHSCLKIKLGYISFSANQVPFLIV